MGAPAEILEEIFTVIEGGQTIGESAEIIQFPSDNGANTFTAVNKTFQGTNGTGLNYWVAAVAEGASAVSAGALMITVSIPEFIAFAVPCLGIAVGTGFYSIDPEGWTNLALLLSNAGWTVRDKVVGFMVDKGIITFPPETIDILVSELERLGVFVDSEKWDSDQPSTFELEDNIYASNKTFMARNNLVPELHYYVGSVYKEDHYMIVGYYLTSADPGDIKVTSAADGNKLRGLICSKSSFTVNRYGFRASDMYLDMAGQVGMYTYTYDNKTVYYGISNENHPVTDSYGTNPDNFNEEVIGQLAWIIQYGSFEEGEYQGLLQHGADLPDPKVPVRTKYPDWLPWEFPELPGWSIPETMPMAYPELLPKETEPYQSDAQNPEGDDETADEGIKKLEDPETDPENPTPEESTEEDPEESEDGDEIKDPTDEDENRPDPIDPDPPTPITPTIVVPSLPDSVNSNKLFSVYNPSLSQLGQLGGYLWDNDLIDILRKIWQNPLDGIISLIQVYATPVTGGNSNIILGYLDSGVSAPVVSNQFVTIDCGSIVLNEQSENCLDYIPYTKLELYLPFIGITEIDTNEFMSGTINVKYKVDVYTGTCLAEVKCTRNRDLANGTILYTFSGNCSQQIPLTSGDARGVFGALVSAVGLGLSVATGGATAMVAAGTVAGLAGREMLHVSHSGNLSANAGIMGQKKPYLIINRKRAYTANSYNRYYGFPANKTVSPGNHTGFLRLKAGRLQSAATEQEKAEIYELLNRGVIM